MKKKLARIIAGFLFACMVIGSVPTGAVLAEETGAEDGSQTAQEADPGDNNSAVLPETEEEGSDSEEISEEDQTVTAQPEDGTQQPDGVTAETDGEDPQNEDEIAAEDFAQGKDTAAEADGEIESGEIRFVYIESPYLETPGTQRIVFSFEQEISGADEICLTVEDEAGNREEWPLSRQAGSLYLFEKQYTGDAYTGTYHAVSLDLYGEEEKTILLDTEGVNAEFGVNEEYEGIEELKPLDGTSEAAGTRQVEASVVTIDENGVTGAEDSIAEALNTVSAETAVSNGISTFSADPEASSKAGRPGDIVVALDPGHDAMDGGAQGNGLREEDLTLKIANYCKAELERYSGVTVYMTRTTAACPYNMYGASCIAERVKAAANAGAQIFVSFHLNSALASSANGAEVIVPNRNWKYEVGIEGENLGQTILNELVQLGLSDRGIYAKDTTVADYYPDGSPSDYFSVQYNCKYYGIPGIIVEHAFISNSGDASRFLKTEAGLKSLGVADATGIAKYLGLGFGRWETDSAGNTYYYEGDQKVYGGKKIGNAWYYFDLQTGAMYHDQWREKEGEWYYYDSDGIMLANKGSKIDGCWYYFTSTGAMLKSDWRNKEGEWYYYDANGHMISDQEYKIDIFWYYFSSTGAMLKSDWRQQDGKWYYYDADGHKVMDKGIKIDIYWYYFMSDGTMLSSGWREKNGDKYYYDAEGHMVANKGVKIDGFWYYFTESGAMLSSGWREKNGEKYYYDADGHMVAGRSIEIDGRIYYFTSSGALQSSSEPEPGLSGWDNQNGEWYYYTDGIKVVNKGLKIDGYWYYFTESGAMLSSGWREKNGEKYYYDAEGHMAANKGVKIDGYWYYFTESGAMLSSGWREKNGEKYYYDADGHMAADKGVKIDGYWHYFTESGAMLSSGWREKNGDKYYYDADGHMAADKGVKIDGYWYYFTESGAMLSSGWREKNGEKYYYDAEGHMAANKGVKIDGLWYYFTESGAMLSSGWRDKEGTKYYYDEAGHMIADRIMTIDGVTYYFDPSGAACEDLTEAKYTIAGESSATVQDLIDYYENTSSIEFPAEALGKGGASTLKEFCQIYYEECKTEGIKVEVAFAQAMLETGFLKYGGDVKIEQFNFAGLGAVGGGASGASFPDVRTGIRAHVQHLKCYANTDPLNNTCVDPRWSESLRGKAPYVSYLSIPHNPYGTGWAADANYGTKLMKGIGNILNS